MTNLVRRFTFALLILLLIAPASGYAQLSPIDSSCYLLDGEYLDFEMKVQLNMA
jgi:hypothetical protein